MHSKDGHDVKTIRLGRTGLQVSRVGMGGIPIQRPPLDEAIRIINRALDLGVNFIDTSLGYGDSEERIGKAVAGRRDKVVLATKGGFQEKKSVLSNIDLSLKRLNTDYIDLWQFHGVHTLAQMESILGPSGGLEGAREALQTGKIKHIGFSSHNLDIAKEMILTDQFETIQFPFDFVAREAADELVPLAKERDVGFIAMKPFAGGNIRDAKLAIRYLLQFDNVVPDPGIQRVEEIEEIVEIVNGTWELTPDDWVKIEEIRNQLTGKFCRQCQYCMPCPNGVEIWLLMHVDMLFRLWPKELALNRPLFAKAAESGKKCVKCGACEPKCPYNLPIREIVAENMRLHEKVAKGEL